jgi:hypothetical protein
MLISVTATGLLVWNFGLRPDFAARVADDGFLLEQSAALITAIAGIYAALCAGLPDQPEWKLWLPLVPVMLWLGTLLQHCRDILAFSDPGRLLIGCDPVALLAIPSAALLPAITIVVMLRRSGPYRVLPACICGALGSAALSAAALRLYHIQDAPLMVLIWQFGTVALFSLLAGGVSRIALARL